MRENQRNDAIHSFRTFEMVSWIDLHSCQKIQYKDFELFGYQYNGRFTLINNQKPGHISIFRLVTDNSDVMSAFTFLHGLWLNLKANIIILWEVGVAWIVMVWQEDTVPCHTSRRQFWLWENFYYNITPYNWSKYLPDCNPLDNYVCGLVKRETKHREYQRWPEGNDNGSIYQFKQRGCLKGL